MNKTLSVNAADNIRIFSAAMVEKANSGHPGGAMGGADFIHILYTEFLNFDPNDMSWPFRDRFFLDPGHMSPMLYSVLAFFEFYAIEDIKNFRQWGSVTPGHPELDVARGIENTSGPLGLGQAMAVGAAIAERFLAARFGEWTMHKTYTFVSDGGIQEGISQGAGRIAGFLGLHNLIMFYDANEIQLSTRTDEVTAEDTAKKYEAWGWNVITIKGNDHEEIRYALKSAIREQERPTLIIGKTIMGKGLKLEDGSSFESQVSTHGQPVSKAGASFPKTIEMLGGDPDEPFRIFPEVMEYYKQVSRNKAAFAIRKKQQQSDWEKENPELAEKLHSYLSGELPDLDLYSIHLKDNIATRAASGAVLEYLAQHVENMIVLSADLSNSDKTEGFIKGGARPFGRGDFTGGFLHTGVSELTMAALANGIALHGGIHVACGTFFVFSDFMKPAIRLAALMELPVTYIWTHDAFRVGEDGPTHQPVEQEAQIRLMEKVKNHSGRNSMLVLRPADTFETLEAWMMAMHNTNSPTGLILTRQAVRNIPDIPGTDRISQVKQTSKGAYVVMGPDHEPDLLLIANGSEVISLIEIAHRLKNEHGISARVISVISEGLFRSQPKSYQEDLIPTGVPSFGLTAGLRVNLAGLVGCNGQVYGMDHFGYSAPAAVLEEKFGFTIDNIYREVMRYIQGKRL